MKNRKKKKKKMESERMHTVHSLFFQTKNKRMKWKFGKRKFQYKCHSFRMCERQFGYPNILNEIVESEKCYEK